MWKSKPPVEIIDAEFTVVRGPHEPEPTSAEEPGFDWSVFISTAIVGGLIALRHYLENAT